MVLSMEIVCESAGCSWGESRAALSAPQSRYLQTRSWTRRLSQRAGLILRLSRCTQEELQLTNNVLLTLINAMEDDNPFTKAQTVDPEVRAYVYSLVNAVCSMPRDNLSRSNIE
jgi:hypothetical protein